jgi:hypothetical protein
MEMRYVQRDGHGKVVGHYALPQPQADGSMLTDSEPLSVDHPDIEEYRQRTAS